MLGALEKAIDDACPDRDQRHDLRIRARALFEELTKDDAPVFRSPLGRFHKIDR